MADDPVPVVVRAPPSPARLYPKRPAATLAILSLTFLTFFVMSLADFANHPPWRAFLLRTFTGVSADPELLLRFGASYGPYIHRGEYWRLVMPMFLHVGALHFLINAYALYILGRILEQMYDYGRFAVIYVGCGIGSALLSMTVSPNVSAGASGAIFGIAGAMLVAGYLHRDAIPPHWGRAFGRGILPLILLNLILGFSIKQVLPIDNWGHVGGLLTGILLAVVIPPPRRQAAVYGVPAMARFQVVTLLPVVIVGAAMAATAQNYRTYQAVSRLLQEGERFEEQHEDAKALDRFQQASARAPRDERPHEELGTLHLDQNRLADASREFNEALRLNPASGEAKLGLASVYKKLGNQTKVREILKEMEDALPPGPDSQAALGELCARQKLYAEAIQHYERALRMKPGSAVAHNNLAWLLATCDDPAYRNPRQALEHARKAVELSSWKEATFIDTLAEAFYANQDYSQAVEIEARALQLDPNDEEFRAHMERYRKAASGAKS